MKGLQLVELVWCHGSCLVWFGLDWSLVYDKNSWFKYESYLFSTFMENAGPL